MIIQSYHLTYRQFECSIFKWSICRPKNHGIPLHDIIIARCSTNSSWRILLKQQKNIYIFFVKSNHTQNGKITPTKKSCQITQNRKRFLIKKKINSSLRIGARRPCSVWKKCFKKRLILAFVTNNALRHLPKLHFFLQFPHLKPFEVSHKSPTSRS